MHERQCDCLTNLLFWRWSAWCRRRLTCLFVPRVSRPTKCCKQSNSNSTIGEQTWSRNTRIHYIYCTVHWTKIKRQYFFNIFTCTSKYSKELEHFWLFGFQLVLGMKSPWRSKWTLTGMAARASSSNVLALSTSMKGEVFGSGEITDDKITPAEKGRTLKCISW